MSAPARLHAYVRGRVQGVGFRHFVRTQAEHLGVMGWVRNEPDRRVQVVAEGERAALEALLAALHRGPPWASVRGVAVSWENSTDEFDGFTVRR